MVYEYANYLDSRGHQVTIVHPALIRLEDRFTDDGLLRGAKRFARFAITGLTGSHRPRSWFPLRTGVRVLWRPSLNTRYIPDADIVIATAWQTAEWVATYPPSKGRCFYLIQHYEAWSGPEDRVRATWRLPLEKIVIADWLHDIATELGEPSHLVYNGLDFNRFRLITPIEERDSSSVLMLFHNLDWKGSPDGIAAFELARQQAPDLRLTVFSIVPRPPGLPGHITYHQNPPQDLLASLYNSAAIFLAPSWTEGFPLPPAESMQCGAALVCTDIGGHRPYAHNGSTALLSPVKNPAAMATNILRLYNDRPYRIRIARAGYDSICQFTWERAGSQFEAILKASLKR